jgi:protease II
MVQPAVQMAYFRKNTIFKMINLRCIPVACILILSACTGGQSANSNAPRAKKVNKVFTEQGVERTDPYAWLSNPDDSNVIRHLEAENAFTAASLKHTEGLQKEIYDELVARIEQQYESLPVQENGYWYYTRFETGAQYPLYCRKAGITTAPEQVMLDVNALAKGHQVYLVRGQAISRDNQWLAFAEDTSGDRRCTMRLQNLSNGASAPDVISNTSGNYAWGERPQDHVLCSERSHCTPLPCHAACDGNRSRAGPGTICSKGTALLKFT